MRTLKEITLSTCARHWTYSCMLAVGYLLAFFAMTFANPYSMELGTSFACLLSVLMLQATRSNYFMNCWDAFWHWTVVVDVFLEAIFISTHDHWGFVLCWLAFGIVVGGYRFHKLKIHFNIQ